MIALSRDCNPDEKYYEAGTNALQALHKLMLPFVLRRRKCDVLSDLPPKIVQDIFCDLSDLQAVLYRDFVEQVKQERQTNNNLSLKV